jgi:hypothetical protein
MQPFAKLVVPPAPGAMRSSSLTRRKRRGLSCLGMAGQGWVTFFS